ncbi:alpha/beta fold hydrolase [Enteractinococcus fodinae]|uniref:2-hydroxy-6-oxonona-2,4-dienedioate hydrolase n=1 Tax=Enteractinococcus fodinae TaxID=684663 RepID=A0ABU2B4A3_9MICC|nr:alpha/beta hydrolase [Enteractinococcus fodinae]MDR7348435.1 2-hydroxy-6-oxonona-2,4-dienedioate hydrolase [Enteractinococcus fodinae]
MTLESTANVTAEGTARRIRTTDWEIHFHEAGSGHPLILIHGSAPGTSGWKNFYPNIEVLSKSFRVLALDLPGWGDSDPASPDKANHVEAVLQFMDALQINQAALVGNSMGAMTALRVASEWPDRVSHIVASGSAGPLAPKIFSPEGMSEGLRALISAYQEPNQQNMREFYDAITFEQGVISEEAVAERAEAAAAREDHRNNFLAGISTPGYLPMSTIDQVSAITAPTLLIHGRDDRVVHFENSLQLCTLISSARLYLMNQCGHCPQLEYPDEYNRVVKQFIEAS